MTFGETEVKAKAQELGFIACGITDLAPNQYGAALDAWLERGLAGTMRYLHRQAAKRKQPADIDGGARRAVIVLDSYGGLGSEGEDRPKIAKYARGRDYHLEMRDRLEILASELVRAGGARIARIFVDAGPVPERELGRRAGLGWIGKTRCSFARASDPCS